MMASFRRQAAGLFDVTRPDEYRDYYKGTYGVQYVKAAASIRRLLAVDREILALSTSFTDLQPRVNQLAIEIIDSSDGRLENTIAIIVHKDPHGDNKLKTWGRDVGLTVIPLYMAGGSLPSGTLLERRLLAEFFAHDPFNVTGPVSNDSQFYGRRDEAQDLARHLQEGQVRACLGVRKSGKTSILHRIVKELQTYHNCYVTVIDCSRDSVWEMNAAALLSAIASAIEESLSTEEYTAEVKLSPPHADLSGAYARLVETLRRAPGTVVLMFDEVDYITPGSPTSTIWRDEFNPFWRNLRAAYQELARTDHRLSVFVSGVSSKWFQQEDVAGIENAALAFVPDEYLSPLTPGASITMLKNLGRASGLVFDDEGAKLIGEACGHIPFWVRKAGSFVHRNTDVETRPLNITPVSARVMVEAFIKQEGSFIAEVAMNHLFRVFPELEAVAEACVAGDASGFDRSLISALHRYGILKSPSSYPEISGQMMAAGLSLAIEHRRSATSDRKVVPATEEGLRYATLTEWAEEIAVIGARRNLIEKRLRGLAVNVLRMDALANKAGGNLLDRILKSVDSARASKMRILSADDAVEKLFWLELTRLIEHEWKLIGALFSDKKLFAQHALVLNDRLDAHAKNADRSDVALQRKALTWFEEALARS